MAVRPLVRTRAVLAIAAVALALAGCVHVPSGSGDTATFSIDGGTISVTQSGTISFSGSGTPLDYSGPLGCAGRYFSADYTEDIGMNFRYGSRDAYLLVGNDLYHFAHPPTIGDGTLGWKQDFDDRNIAVTVRCGPPPTSTPPGPLTD
ncbi:MAG: hypothetical protein ACJ77A_10875 [Actinomycetota bacterium]